MRKSLPKLKYIKRSGCWCLTYWEGDKQKQKWITKEEKAAEIDFILENASSESGDRALIVFLKGLESG